MPGSASVAAKAKSGDYNSDTSSKEAAQTIQVYNTLAWVSVFVLATGIASGDYSSNAFLKEAAASKQAMPGSASVAAKAKSGDWFALHSLAYTCTLLLFVVLVRTVFLAHACSSPASFVVVVVVI